MEVKWAPLAFDDLAEIFAHIMQDNPTAAQEVIRTIYRECRALKNFPNRGRVGRCKGRRELVLSSLPYVAVYQVKEKSVEISRIYHTARNWS